MLLVENVFSHFDVFAVVSSHHANRARHSDNVRLEVFVVIATNSWKKPTCDSFCNGNEIHNSRTKRLAKFNKTFVHTKQLEQIEKNGWPKASSKSLPPLKKSSSSLWSEVSVINRPAVGEGPFLCIWLLFFANHERRTVWHSKSFANIAKMFIMTAMLNMQFGSPQWAGGHFATSTYQRMLFCSQDRSVMKIWFSDTTS